MLTIEQAHEEASKNAKAAKLRNELGIPPISQPSRPGTNEYEVRKCILYWVEKGNELGWIGCKLEIDEAFDSVDWNGIARCLEQVILHTSVACSSKRNRGRM